MKCPHCAAENKDAAKFCGKCGQSLATPSAPDENAKVCPGCGHGCKPDAKFCPKCGHNFGAAPPAENTATTPAEAPASAATPDMMPCPHCGAALKPDAKFCGKCGNSITAAIQEEPLEAPVVMEATTPSPMVAAIELPETAPAAEEKPVQPLPESIVETVTPAIQADELKTPPPATAMPVIETAANGNPKPSRKIPLAPIAAGVAALVIALGAGGYFLMKGKSSPVANELAPSDTTTQPAVPPKPTAPPLAAAPQPVELPPPNLNQGAPSVAPPHSPTVTEKPASSSLADHPEATPPIRKPKQAEKIAEPVQANPLQTAINASMEEGEQCMARKKFDCAISSANTILRFDSRNARALEMKRKAKEAQDRALSQIDIQ